MPGVIRASQRLPRPEREAAMLDAAGAAFAEHGFHAASMDAIAGAAGISKPMLYNYFGSKEGLYTAYLERSGRALVAVMRDAAPLDAPAPERLEAGARAFFSYVEEHRTGWAALYNEAVTQSRPVAAEIAALRGRVAGMVAGVIAADRTPVGDGEREALAHAFVGAGESLANWWLANPTASADDMARILVRFARAALRGGAG
jgi:AcrR family transcriptional regulator